MFNVAMHRQRQDVHAMWDYKLMAAVQIEQQNALVASGHQPHLLLTKAAYELLLHE